MFSVNYLHEKGLRHLQWFEKTLFITSTTGRRFRRGNGRLGQGNSGKNHPHLHWVGLYMWVTWGWGSMLVLCGEALWKRGWRLSSVPLDSKNIVLLSRMWLGRQYSSVILSPLMPGIHEKLLLYCVWKIAVCTQKCHSLAPPGKCYEDTIKQIKSQPSISLKNSNKWKWLLIACCQWYNVAAFWVSELDLFWIYYNTHGGKCMFVTSV